MHTPVVIDVTKSAFTAHPGMHVIRDASGNVVALCPLQEGVVCEGQFSYAPAIQRSVNAHPELVKAVEAAKVVIGMMERPDGLGADVSSALDQRVAQIDAALSLAKGEGK